MYSVNGTILKELILKFAPNKHAILKLILRPSKVTVTTFISMHYGNII